MIIQVSSLLASSPLGGVARNHARATHEMRCECEKWGKKEELHYYPPHSMLSGK